MTGQELALGLAHSHPYPLLHQLTASSPKFLTFPNTHFFPQHILLLYGFLFLFKIYFNLIDRENIKILVNTVSKNAIDDFKRIGRRWG